MRSTAKLICLVAIVPFACQAQAQEFKIGFAISLSGYLAPYDAPTLEGARMAIKDLNAGGGLAGVHPIVAIVKDVRSDTPSTRVAVQELIDEGANVIVVPCDDDPTIAGGLLAQQAKIPVFSTCASTATLPETIGDYYFMNYLSDTLEGAALAKYATAQGYKTAYLLVSPDTVYTTNVPQYFAKAFEALGGKSLGSTTFKMGQQDFSAEVTRMKELNPKPDVIVTAAYEPDFPAFIKQLRGQGLTVPVLGADGIDSPTTLSLGEAGEGVVFVNAGNPESNPDLRAFFDRFEKETGTPLTNSYVATGYDLLQVLDAAAKSAGTIDGPPLRNAIDGIKDLHVTTGMVTYAGNNRIPSRSISVNKVVNGKATFVATYQFDASVLPAPTK